VVIIEYQEKKIKQKVYRIGYRFGIAAFIANAAFVVVRILQLLKAIEAAGIFIIPDGHNYRF
jgi:hypothetical protein